MNTAKEMSVSYWPIGAGEQHDPMSSTLKEHLLTVAGQHPFPLDMLRQEHLWPCREVDVAMLYSSLSQRFSDNLPEAMFMLCGVHDEVWKPNAQAWLSYGWKVREHVVRRT
jgi:hypothetical protein